jgi:hypothetical protein
VCLDTDPVNRSFVGFAALEAKPIELLTKDQLNIRGVDLLLESVLTDDTKFVIDGHRASVSCSAHSSPHSRRSLSDGCLHGPSIHSSGDHSSHRAGSQRADRTAERR